MAPKYNCRVMGRYGSGSLFQRNGSEIWYYQAWVNGRQIGPKSARTADRKKAQLELDKLLGKRARGEEFTNRGEIQSVADVLTRYLAYADERLKSARVIRWVVKANVLPALGKLRLAACDTFRLRKYRGERQRDGADEATINRELSYLRAAWRRVLKEGLINSIPYFPMTQEDNARQGFLEECDFLHLLTQLDKPLKAFGCCAYYAGMRRGELLRLTLADVDLDRGYLTVLKPKNDEPRAVPIFDGPMREWLQWAWGNRRAGQIKVFVWEDGRPFTERNFYDRWHAACSPAGVDDFIPHDCRRSASRNMRNEGIPRSMRKKVMGHKTDSMDERYGIVDFEDAELVKQIMSRRGQTTAKTTAVVIGGKLARGS